MHEGAWSNIYNLVGFIDESGSLAEFAATRKRLQHPRKFGIGLYFEAALVDSELGSRVAELCCSVGFFGMCEAEFIEGDQGFQLIDFNPRPFQGMDLPIARGLRLPLIWYHAALGQMETVERLQGEARASAEEDRGPSSWCLRNGLRSMILARRLVGRLDRKEHRQWRAWTASERKKTIDAAEAADDPWPGRIDGLVHAWSAVRRPRYFAGTFIKD